jgi:hypothetical protein
MLLPIVLWIYPLWIVYRVLRGDLISNHNAAVRAVANCGILIFGFLVAGAVPFGVYWLLTRY